MPFDPTQPFTVVTPVSGFDPSKPFTVVTPAAAQSAQPATPPGYTPAEVQASRSVPPNPDVIAPDMLTRIWNAVTGAAAGAWNASGQPNPVTQAANAAADRDLPTLAPVIHGINYLADQSGRPLAAAIQGAQAGVAQTGAELGAPQLGRDLAAMPEAFAGMPGALRTPEPVAGRPAGLRIEPTMRGPEPGGTPVAPAPTSPPPAPPTLALAGPEPKPAAPAPTLALPAPEPPKPAPTAPAETPAGETVNRVTYFDQAQGEYASGIVKGTRPDGTMVVDRGAGPYVFVHPGSVVGERVAPAPRPVASAAPGPSPEAGGGAATATATKPYRSATQIQREEGVGYNQAVAIRDAEVAEAEARAKAEEAAKPDPAKAHGGPWTEAGKNTDGETVYANPDGRHAVFVDGVPWAEAAGTDPEKRKPRYQIVGTGQGDAPDKPAPATVKPNKTLSLDGESPADTIKPGGANPLEPFFPRVPTADNPLTVAEIEQARVAAQAHVAAEADKARKALDVPAAVPTGPGPKVSANSDTPRQSDAPTATAPGPKLELPPIPPKEAASLATAYEGHPAVDDVRRAVEAGTPPEQIAGKGNPFTATEVRALADHHGWKAKPVDAPPPAASIIVDGQTFTSESLDARIKVGTKQLKELQREASAEMNPDRWRKIAAEVVARQQELERQRDALYAHQNPQPAGAPPIRPMQSWVTDADRARWEAERAERDRLDPQPENPPLPVDEPPDFGEKKPVDAPPPQSGGYVMLDPAQIAVDPARFQYKESGEGGVTGALHGIDTWEPALANPITAWQDKSGKLWVVNGHQRTDLAKRAQTAGQQGVQMPARVFREEDGYTPEYMRALGAYQNIAEGSGTAIDAAKVMRAADAIPDTFKLPSLPPRGQIVRDAAGLTKLSDEAFGAAVNGVILPAYAAHVGNLLSDPTEQMAAIDILTRGHPANSDQARMMVLDVRASGFLRGEQTSLFGDEDFARSLVPERARVLDGALRQLRRAKTVFRAAIEGEDTLTSVGNKLDREGNTQARTDNERLIDTLERESTTRGPISDALTAAARDLAGGKPIGSAVSRFIAAARDPGPVQHGAADAGDGHAGESEGGEVEGQDGLFEGRGLPSLIPAVRVAGKTYTGTDHANASGKVPREGNEDVASVYGFVDDRGRFLDRTRAYEYAEAHGLLAPGAEGRGRSELTSGDLRGSEGRKLGPIPVNVRDIVPAMRITPKNGRSYILQGKRGELHDDVVSRAYADDESLYDNKHKSELGFVDETTGRWYSRDDAARAVGVHEASELLGNLAESPGLDQTETPAFRAWFGGSKVVDGAGRPLVVYHGSPKPYAAEAAQFEIPRVHESAAFFTDSPYSGNAYAFSLRYRGSDRVAPNVIPVYLSMKNPLEVDFGGKVKERGFDPLIWHAEEHGYDGLIIRNVIDSPRGDVDADPQTVYAAFFPTQIKSAIGNRGTFDPTDPNILAEQSGIPTPLYSATSRAVDALKQAKGTGEQMLAAISKTPGVKPEEMKWLGLDDWLRGRGVVTKAEIQDFVREHAVDVREVMRGDPHPLPPAEYRRWINLSDRVNGGETLTVAENKELDDLEFRARAFQGPKTTKYSGYTLPGGENYRELLLTLPPKPRSVDFGEVRSPGHDYGATDHIANWQGQHEVKGVNEYPFTINGQEMGTITHWPYTFDGRGNRAPEKYVVNSPWVQNAQMASMEAAKKIVNERYNEAAAPGQNAYHSSHWDEPNVLAHVRFDERDAPDGAHVLMVHEVQSDWHQAGRRSGYKGDVDVDALRLREQELIGKGASATPEEKQEWADIMNRIQASGKAVPDAPFKTSWSALAMRRIIKYAADNGFDRVAWSPGAVHADRYDLSKQISSLDYQKNANGTYRLSYQKDRRGHMIGDAIPAEKLEDYVGKDVAKKIVDGGGKPVNFAATNDRPNIYNRLSGLDLKVGGEGMTGFYDNILPKETNKIIGKFGAKVGRSLIGTGESEPGQPWRRDTSTRLFDAADRAEAAGDKTAMRQLIHAGEHIEDPGSDHVALFYGFNDAAKKYLTEAGGAPELPATKEPVHSFDLTPELQRAAQTEGMALFAGRRLPAPPRDAAPDLFGTARPSAPTRTPEPTIRDDQRQAVMPGMEPSARQAQAARDAAGPRGGQKAADEGLFGRPETEQPELPPDWATSHAKDLNGSVAWHQGDIALIRGRAVNGRQIYVPAKDGFGRARVDFGGYTGTAFTVPELQALRAARERVAAADEAAERQRLAATPRRSAFANHGQNFTDMTGEAPTHGYEEAADWVMRMGRETGHEHIAVVDNQTGEIVHAGTSHQAASVAFPHANVLGEDGRYTIHHNHPSGTALSPQDMTMLVNKGVSNVVSHGHNGVTTWAAPGPVMRGVRTDKLPELLKASTGIHTAHSIAANMADQIVRPLMNAGELTRDHANALYTDVANRILHAQGLIDYHSTLPLPDAVQAGLDKQLKALGNADRPARTLRPEERVAGLPGPTQGQPGPRRQVGGSGGQGASGELREGADSGEQGGLRETKPGEPESDTSGRANRSRRQVTPYAPAIPGGVKDPGGDEGQRQGVNALAEASRRAKANSTNALARLAAKTSPP